MKHLVFLIILVFISCNESKPQIDDLQVDNDVSGSESDGASLDEISDPEKIADLDNESNESPDADVDTAVECLDLRYNENTLKTGFPFKDKDGKPTFCRPGCDTPTETEFLTGTVTFYLFMIEVTQKKISDLL